MGKVGNFFNSFGKSLASTFTGNYNGTNGNDNIHLLAISTTIHTKHGHDKISGVGGGLKVRDESGHLDLYGAAIGVDIRKSQWGNIYFAGAAGSSYVESKGNGNITFNGAAGSSRVKKYGDGEITFRGVAGHSDTYQSGDGNLYFGGAAGSAKVTKYGNGKIEFNGAAGRATVYQSGSGNVTFRGAAASVDVDKHGSGDVRFYGAAGGANVYQNGTGNIDFRGAGGGVTINKTGNGAISVYGAAAHTSITQNNGTGDIRFGGAGANVNIRKTAWGSSRTGNIVLQGGVGNVNVNYTRGYGDIIFQGAAGNLDLDHAKGNITTHGAVGNANIHKHGDGHIEFKGLAGAINVNHYGNYGTIKVNGAAAYSKVLRRSSNQNSYNNNIQFYGAGAYTNVTQEANGNIDFKGAGASNVLNHHANGNIDFNGASAANVLTHKGTSGDTTFNGGGLGNVIVHEANGNVTFNGAGLGNVIYHGGSTGDLHVSAGGVVNVLVRNGNGNFDARLLAAANVSVHLGNGQQNISQLGGLNTHTHIGDGDAVLGMAGGLNVATLIGNGTFYGGFLGVGNVLTKVGTGDGYIEALGAGNVLTHVDTSDNYSDTAALLLGGANILTKAGNGDLSGFMAGGFNVATHLGDGDVAIAQLGGGNILTKVGDGHTVALQFGIGNINTQVGNGTSLALMAGKGNIYTKVGDGLSAAGMLGLGNIYTHVGSGDSIAVMAAQGNVFTKVEVNDQQPDDLTAAAMFGGGNIFTHLGDGTTGALMLSVGNVFTKVGDGTTVAAMGGQGNIATHIGDGMTLAVMGATGNILTKVGDGTTAGLMIGGGNIFTHVGDGNTIGLTAGKGNIVTKVGQGDQINVAFGKGNIVTHVSTEGDKNNSYNVSMGEANILTKVGDGKQVSVVGGKANIVTHLGDGDDVNLIFGQQGSIVTKVGDGNTITGIINSKLNVITHVGDGDNLQGVWGQGNIVTKVGDGTSSSVLKGDGNIITAVGDGSQVGVLWGKGNIVTKVGDGTSVNILKGEGNIHTKIGDGTSIGVMKGSANINVQVGDGDSIFAAHANHNISVKIGDGDYYGFTFAKTKSSALEKAKNLGSNLLQTAGGFLGSEVISQLVWGAPPTSEEHEQETISEGNNEQLSPENSLETPQLLNTVSLSFDEESITKRSQSDNYSIKPETISIEEKTLSSNLNDNNIESINNNNQSSEIAASGSLAGEAGAKLQNGIDQVKTDINSLIDQSEQVLGNGGEVSQVLDDLTNTLVSQLEVLDKYIDKGDELLSGGNNSSQNEFSQGIVGRVNNDLDDTFNNVNEQLGTANDKVSEAEVEITKATLEAKKRQLDADESQSDALSAKSDAEKQQLEAESRVSEANNKANIAQNEANNQVNKTKNNAEGEKRDINDQPTDRKPSDGSGLDNKTVQTVVNIDDSFGEFSDTEIEANKDSVLSTQQQYLLDKGISKVDILPVLKEGDGLEEEEEEDEGNGNYGKTHVGKTDNGISGLKASWKESKGVESWLDGEHYLTANLRAEIGKYQIQEVYNNLTSILSHEAKNINDEWMESIKKLFEIDENFNTDSAVSILNFSAQLNNFQKVAMEDAKYRSQIDYLFKSLESKHLLLSILDVGYEDIFSELYDRKDNDNPVNDVVVHFLQEIIKLVTTEGFKLEATFTPDYLNKKGTYISIETEINSDASESRQIKFASSINSIEEILPTQDGRELKDNGLYDEKSLITFKITRGQDDDNPRIIKGVSLKDQSTFRLKDTGLKFETFEQILSMREGNRLEESQKRELKNIATSLLKYKRQEGVGYQNILQVEDNRNGYEIIYDAVTQTRELSDKNQYKSHSINHILADSAIASILHKLAAEAINNQWDYQMIEEKVEPFLEALDNQSFNYISNNNNYYNNQDNSFSDKALEAFKKAVEGGVFTKKYLYEAIHTISYAPGNIRWGDSNINTLISNFFDPIFELDKQNEENQYIKLDNSSKAIYDAVSELAFGEGNLITEEQFKLATKLAGNEKNGNSDSTVFTSSKIINWSDSYFELIILEAMNSEKRDIVKNPQENLDNQIVYDVEETLLTILKANNRNEDSSIKEPSSGIDKASKRIDYEIINNSTNEAGDQLTIYRIIDPNGGEPLYRVQIDIEGDKSQRISIFSSENPIQPDGSIRLPDTTTIVSHGEKLDGTYTTTLENHYLGPDDQYLRIGANDFRNIENIETAEYQAANSENNLYLLTKYRGEDEGLGIDTSKNQEQILLTTLRDRTANDKPNIGYVTVGKHTQVTSQQAEAALSRFGTTTIISGYCRACGTVDNAETYRAKVKDSAIDTHYDGIEDFAYNIKQTIEDVAQTRQTDLEGRRSSTVEKLIQQGQTIGGNIEQKPFSIDPQLPFPDIESNKIDTNGNLQVQVGDGEFTAAFWGNTNIGIKVGDGGFKAAAFGDNNIFVHIGDGDTAKHTQTIGNYTAFEGAQLFIGQRNVSFNYGVSNDFIVMLDQSIPLPPFQSPFTGPTDIVSYLKEDIAQFNVSGDSNDVDPLTGDPIEDNYYDSQNYLWSQGNAQQIIEQISSLDQNSSVEYDTVFDYGSESDRNIRALQADTERALNKGFNRVLAGGSPFKEAQGTPLKDQNFNLTIAGQGADIMLTNGDNQFMFADNIPSLLDTTIASVFGMLSQETNDENGQVGNTFSYDPRNALGNFLNQLIARVSTSLPDLTLGEALGLTYDAQGNITTTDAQRLTQEDLDSIREAFAQFVGQNAQKAGLDLKDEETGANFDITNPRNLLGLFEAFGNGNLSKFIDPDGLVDSLKSALDTGEDGLNSFRDRLSGEEEETTATPPATETTETDNLTPPAVPVVESSEVFGFGGLTLPSVFDIDIPQLFSTKTLDDMVGLVNSFEGDIDTMQEQMFDFFANSGYMTGDGDLLVSLGNNNFTWGGDGNDLVGLMGLNNNFWGGDGDDLYYGMGENNQGSGNEGDDTAVLIGINNLFFGGEGHDFALAAGRYANLSGGEGDDTMYVLGSDSWLNGGDGEDYLVAVGNYNAIVSGEGNDYVVSIGNYGDVESGAGEDVVTVFGNKNTVKTEEDDDYLRIMGHQGEVFAGAGNDFFWTDQEAKENTIKGDAGDDTFVLGGSNNIYYSGEGQDSFIISHNYQEAVIKDISSEDLLMFADVADSQLWFNRDQDNLLIYVQNTPNNEEDKLTNSSLSIEDYFNNQQADIVLDTGLVSDSGETAYEILTQEGLLDLIDTMSNYDVLGSTDAFLNNVSEEQLEKLAIAWDNTSIINVA